MLHKKHNALVTFAVLLALVGVTKPAKAFLTAQSDRGNLVSDTNLNAELEDSGSTNTDLEESGRVNPDLEGSGTFNPDFEGGGEINSDFSDSGSTNTELEESGKVNSDLESSGEPLSKKNTKAQGKVTARNIPGEGNERVVVADNSEIDRQVIVQNNTIEETPDVEVAERESNWWWWLIPLIGIPLLAVIIALGGRNRSDREPAIDNIPNNDPGDGVMGFANPSDVDGDGLSGVGTNSNDSDVNASMVGGAMAGGTALSGETAIDDRREEIEPEPTEPVAGIPSDSVSEFTGQETKLQVGDRPTMLQTDDEQDTDPDRPEFFDRVAQSGASVAGTMGLGSVVAANPDRDDTVNEGAISSEPDTDLETSPQLADFPATVNETVESVPASDVASETTSIKEADLNREFRGDYVLQEEPVTPKDTPNSDISNPNIDLELEDTTDDTWETSTDLADNRANIETVVDEDTTAELNYTATERDLVEDVVTEDFTEESRANDAASTLDVESDNVIDLRQNSNISSETTNVSPTDVDTLEIVDTEITDSPEPEMDLATDRDTVTDVEIDLDNDPSDRANLDDAAIAGGAVLGGTAAANFWEPSLSDNEPTDRELTVEESFVGNFELDRDLSLDTDDEWTDNSEAVVNESAIDAELDFVEGKNTADAIASEDIGDESNAVQSQLQEIQEINDLNTVAETNGRDLAVDNLANSQNSNLDRILDDTDDDSDIVLEDLGFDESDDTEIILEEITFDEPVNSDVSFEDLSFDEPVNDDVSLEDLSFDEPVNDDVSLEELTLENDSDDAIDAILEEITFDESAEDNAGFEDLSFEQSANDDISLEEVTFDESAVDDINLEDRSFKPSDRVDNSFVNDSENTSSDLNVDLDSLGFEEVETKDNSTSNLLENNTADIADLSDDKSDDMSNIAEWLNSLEASRQNTDDISEWLNTLDTGGFNSVEKNRNEDRVRDLEEEADDVSFQFLEDLLEKDSNKSKDNDDFQ